MLKLNSKLNLFCLSQHNLCSCVLVSEQLTGHCECKPGRGGPKCTECENFFYGDPNYQCRGSLKNVYFCDLQVIPLWRAVLDMWSKWS